jgi:hypothetical protein
MLNLNPPDNAYVYERYMSGTVEGGCGQTGEVDWGVDGGRVRSDGSIRSLDNASFL